MLCCFYNTCTAVTPILGQFHVRADEGPGGSFVEHIEYKTLPSPAQSTVVELPWRRNNLSGDSNSKTLKMPKMIFQVLILVSGWAVQTLEGSPTAGLDLQENFQENQIGTQHLTPELLRSLQVIIIIIIVSIMI